MTPQISLTSYKHEQRRHITNSQLNLVERVFTHTDARSINLSISFVHEYEWSILHINYLTLLAMGVADERRSECIPPKVSDWYLEYYGPMSVKSPSKHIEGQLNEKLIAFAPV